MNKKNVWLLILLFVLGESCEKDITIDLPEIEEKIVIEGCIEQGKLPYVLLSKNTPYFSKTDSNTIKNIAIKNATVVISYDSIYDTLTEAIPGYGYYYISQNTIGEIGKTYHLSVSYNNQTYTSETTIPEPIAFDSLWFAEEELKDSLGMIWFRITDPAGKRNFYRVFTKVKSKDDDFIPVWGNVIDDEFFDGLTFEMYFERGIKLNKFSEEDFSEEDLYFHTGDTVYIRFCTMDMANYEFWKSITIQQGSAGSPFASSSTIRSNISGNALGIWSGYGAIYDTVICAKTDSL